MAFSSTPMPSIKEAYHNRSSRTAKDHSPSTKKTERKKVQFNPRARLTRIRTRQSYSREEKKRLWYQEEEYKTFADQCQLIIADMEKNIVCKMKAGVCLDISNHHAVKDPSRAISTVGLEHYTQQGNFLRRRNRSEARAVVLDEQDAQWEEGIDDHDTIAELYRARSAHAKMVAHTRGLRLERVVQECEESDGEPPKSSKSLFSSCMMVLSSPITSNRPKLNRKEAKRRSKSSRRKQRKSHKSTRRRACDPPGTEPKQLAAAE